MITPKSTPWEPRLWRQALGEAFRSTDALLSFLQIEHDDAAEVPAFSTLVPRGFAARMKKGDASDPLLVQVLGRGEESKDAPGFTLDPLEELQASREVNPAAGLLHKYHGRALLITTGACAVNCRYCFRRHFPYAEQRADQLQTALARVAQDPSITEVILSGGDPLLLDDPALGNLVDDIADIAHVKRLRVHTRMPVVLPERITAPLLDILSPGRFQVSVVVHVNNARELDADTARAFTCLRERGIWLFNQAVLLRGVNDTVEAQITLAETLFSQHVLPYYLHLPDRVQGTHHFFVDDASARQVHRSLQARLPGYLVPRLVREAPGAPAKVQI